MMLTKLSLWGIYFASYLVDYLLILVILICKRIVFCQSNSVPFWEGADLLVWGILLLFIVASIVITNSVKNIKMNSRIKLIPEKNITHEMTGCLLAQITTVVTTIFTDWWILISIVMFVIFGFFYVGSNKVHTSPLFVVPMGNKIYESGENVIITKYSKQGMRVAQEDNPDGLEARELAEKVFYVRKR